MLASRLDSVTIFSANRRDGLGVVGRGQHRLGEHAHRADRRLELVADVGDEVAAGRFHPGVLGLVVDVDDGEPAIVLGQQPHVAAHRQPGPAGMRALARGQVDLDVLAGGQRALRGQPGAVVEQPVTHQARARGPGRWCRRRHGRCRPRRSPPATATRCAASICETVMPDCSTARRCRRSASAGQGHAPNAAPIASASSATTAASSSADTTLTRKSYASGERHPSSVRPKRDMSHGQDAGVRFAVHPVFAGSAPAVRPIYFAPWAATAAAPAAAASGSR